jgi:hypothetical protein
LQLTSVVCLSDVKLFFDEVKFLNMNFFITFVWLYSIYNILFVVHSLLYIINYTLYTIYYILSVIYYI